MRMPRFAAGAKVAVYLPIDHETDTRLLITAARRRRVRQYLPAVVDRRHRRLRFLALAGRMRTGAYGIPIPGGAARAVDARWLNLIVVPLVGVGADGARLGMGAGFYDRAVAFRGRRHRWRGPLLIGLAFECQRTAVEFAQAHDLRLDMLATEHGLTHCMRGRQ